MRKESEGVTENLLVSARKEFLQYGFRDASGEYRQTVVSARIRSIQDLVTRADCLRQL